MVKLNPGEYVVAQVRRHPLLFIFESLFLVFFIIVPLIIFAFLSGFGQYLNGEVFYLFTFFYSLILIFVLISFMTIFTNFYLDILIITSEKIIDIDQKRFFSREVATLMLENIEDIKVNVDGIIPSFLDYGDMTIQTSAEAREFVIKGIPHPDETKRLIFDLHSKEVDEPKSVKIVS